MFYDNSILSGTKIKTEEVIKAIEFYDNSILSGTKIRYSRNTPRYEFYDNSILSGTKIAILLPPLWIGFTITQFFQVLK